MRDVVFWKDIIISVINYNANDHLAKLPGQLYGGGFVNCSEGIERHRALWGHLPCW